MAGSSMAPNKKLVCFAVICMVAVVGAAITCDEVTKAVAPCLDYLTKIGEPLSQLCCDEAKSLNSAANATDDRQQLCKCLKQISNSVSGINYGLAAEIPSMCGFTAPFKISPVTDCLSVI